MKNQERLKFKVFLEFTNGVPPERLYIDTLVIHMVKMS